jgi:uncharacterized protein YbjT (DUF2867 family)
VHTPIVVTGGTGTLGRPLVERLRASGQQVRVLSRRPGPERAVADLLTGEGVEAAVAGAGTIIHCATTIRGAKDVRATENLLAAATAAGRPHLVYISIVGIDQLPVGYYRGKLAAEQLIERSGLPYTILRATQFHDLLCTAFGMLAKLPVLVVPAIRCQPVEVGEVATRLAELATGEPLGRVADFGGPRVLPLTELARAYLTATGRRRAVLGIRLPGKTFRAATAGENLTPDHADGTITFDSYLAEAPLRGRPTDRSR